MSDDPRVRFAALLHDLGKVQEYTRLEPGMAKASFTLDGKTYKLAANNSANALHGGLKGFDKVVWTAREMPDGGLELRLRLGSLAEIEHWILSWGAAAEVTAPAELRTNLRRTAAALAAVGIAGVLAMSPSILVLDEPSAGLDPAARRRLIGLLRSFDHTRVIATHDLDLVLDVCDRVLVMHGGRIEADGAPAAILRDQTLLERCRLEPPLRWQGV